MELTAIHTDNDFQNASVPAGQILTFAALDDTGKVITRYKDSGGAFGTLTTGNSGGGSSSSGGSSGSSGTEPPFSVVRIEQHQPYREDNIAPEKVNISGLGYLGDEDWGVDASAANGTYVLLPGYEEALEQERIFKHESAEYYLCYYDNSDEDEPEFSSHWYISTRAGGYGRDALVCCYKKYLPSGANSWSSEYESVRLTTNITYHIIPGQSFILKGRRAEYYNSYIHSWTWGEEVELQSFEKNAIVHNIYAVHGTEVVGNPVGLDTGLPCYSAVFYAPLVTIGNKALTGQTLDIKYTHSAVEYMGRKCLHIAGDVLNIPNAKNTFAGGKNDFTLHIRVCFEQFNTGGIFVLGSNDCNGVAINLVENQGKYYYSFSDASTCYYHEGDFETSLNCWNSICLIRKNGKAYFYVSNLLMREEDFNHTIEYYEGYSGIGGRNANGYGNTCKDMYVCDAIMYDRALTMQEVSDLNRG